MDMENQLKRYWHTEIEDGMIFIIKDIEVKNNKKTQLTNSVIWAFGQLLNKR